MFRQTCTAALIALAVLSSFTLAMALEPKAASGEKQITNSIGMKLTLIPSGEFMMGSGEPAEKTADFFRKNYVLDDLSEIALRSEYPQHRIRITKPFYLGTYDVTRGQFRQFVNDTGYKTDLEKRQPAEDSDAKARADESERPRRRRVASSWRNTGFERTDEHPVVNVSWNDAVAFCKWMIKKECKTYRLPTEAEWEYACRAGTTTRYYSGDDPETLAKVANVADATYKTLFARCTRTIKASDGYVFTSPVGKFKPNAFGLYDMHGNVLQWCADWYDKDYFAKSPRDDPKGPDAGGRSVWLGDEEVRRVARGSSWCDGPADCRSAHRSDWIPKDCCDCLGFRVAMTLR